MGKIYKYIDYQSFLFRRKGQLIDILRALNVNNEILIPDSSIRVQSVLVAMDMNVLISIKCDLHCSTIIDWFY